MSGLGFNFDIDIDEQSSNKHLKDYLSKANKDNLFKVGVDIDTEKLQNLGNELKKATSYKVDLLQDGSMNVVKTFVNEYGETLKIKQQINEQGTVELTNISMVNDELKKQTQINKENAKTEKENKTTNAQFEKRKKEEFKTLLALKKEQGTLDKLMLTVGEKELAVLKEQSKELKKVINSKEKDIKKGGYEDETQRAKITEQVLKNERAINQQKAKGNDDKRAKEYDKLLRSIDREYVQKKKLVNASKEEIALIDKKIKKEHSLQASSNSKIWRNGLKDENLDKLVAQTRDFHKEEVEILNVKKQQQVAIQKQKSLYGDLFKLEKEIGSLTKKSTSGGTEAQGQAYTQILEKQVEFEQKANELKKLGLVDESKENELLSVRKGIQEQILMLEAQLLDKDEKQVASEKEYLALAQRGLQVDAQKLLGGKNGKYVQEEMDGLIKRINALNNVSTGKAQKEVAELKMQLKELTQVASTRAMADTSNGISLLGVNLSKLTGYVSGAMIIRQLWRELGNGVKYIKDLDSALTDLNITMDITKNEFNDLVGQSTNLAKMNGIATSSVLEMAKTYANSTTSIKEVMDKLQGTVALTNVSGMSAGESTSAVQSVLNQFKLVEEGSMSVSEATVKMGDVITSVSKSMAYDFNKGVRELIEGVNVAGSAMYASGMDLESYTSILGTLIETTGKSGSEVANSIN